MGLSAGGLSTKAYTVFKKYFSDKRFKIVNSLPRITTSTANTLTATTFSLKSLGGGIKVPCTYILYILLVCLLFVCISEVLL